MLSKEKQKELEQLESERTKQCSKCMKILPLYEFVFDSRRRKFSSSWCINCQRLGKMKQNYDITVAEYDKMLEKQNGKCAICGTKIPGGKGRFCIDHNHETNEVRGLLCNKCNLMLGNVNDNPGILAKAILYLTKGIN